MTKRSKQNVKIDAWPSAKVPLAIVGIGCMFPKAKGLGAYWANIRDGVDAITDIPQTHWNPADYFDSDKSSPDMTYAKRGGFLEPVDFDPLLYGISPNNIEATDTTQLLGLMVTHRALLDAGYATAKEAEDGRAFDRDRTSVILGVTGTLELVIPLGARLGHPLWRKALEDAGVDKATADDVVERIAEGYVPWQENSFPGLLGNVAAGRIANRFDLGGTNCVVDAACASSLSAIHLAALELQSGRSDMAVTGGLDTFNDIFMYMCFSKTPALSPTGNSRPFSADGDGTILGEGLGVLVLKRLADAERDGDRIYSVIKSIGTSSDGKGNAVYAPSSAGQKKALLDAYREADVEPTTIELVEAHGTGTTVGDAVEAAALVDVYGQAMKGKVQPWCALGSVKSMIGHTKAAAGVAGLIKATMALRHKVLPPTIKVSQPLDVVAPEKTPFYVNTLKRPWLGHEEYKRRAALSAFGFGGSNFHCVLEEYDPKKVAVDYDGKVLIVPFADDDNEGIDRQLDEFDGFREWRKLRALAGQLRERFDEKAPCRLVLIIDKDNGDVAKLIGNAKRLLVSQKESSSWSTPDGAFYGAGDEPGEIGILFPGQGSQRVGMLRDLACQFPAMLDALAMADECWGKEHEDRLSDMIYPQPRFSDEARVADDETLRDTKVAQPSIGAVSAGLWRTLQEFGLAASSFAGHSFGELTALWAGGRYDEKSLYQLAITRGQLMGEGDGDRGSMLAVAGAIEQIEAIIEENDLDVVIANRNSPQQFVLSGSSEAISAAEEVFKGVGLRATELSVSAAFHSEFVADAKQPFAEALKGISFTAANRLPDATVYANTSAEPYPKATAKAKQLLASQLVKPVEFVKQIENMFEAGVKTFVEVGPGCTLTNLVKAILEGKSYTATAVDQSKGKRTGQYDLAVVLGLLASLGYEVDLPKWDDQWQAEVGDELVEKKRGLMIQLSGANYVSPKQPKTPRAKKVSSVEMKGSRELNQTPESKHSEVGRMTAANNDQLAQAIAATQQSIAALQAMQQQTAQLHQQYLQGQQTAQQTLQQLVQQQQALLAGSLGMVGAQPVQPVSSPQMPVELPKIEMPVMPTPIVEPVVTETPAVELPAIESQPVETDKVTHGGSKTRQVLLEVVAEKTGYPVEMLDLEMSLDADLGIDSIKRVEILSALQERLPDLPQVQPDAMGALQTLGQIVEYLGDSRVGDEVVAGSSATRSVDTGRFQQVLLEVISEKTGYPVEMLELEMSLDADLGIDSIKRVEILSALQERLPDAPQVAADDLGALQTLGQIVEYMGEGAANADTVVEQTIFKSETKVTSANLDFKTALLEVVAEKTGYPVEMLELEMSLDADLGIDSIKRVEILSALQERLPDAPQVAADDLGALSTLGEIVEYMNTKGTAVMETAASATAVVTKPEQSESHAVIADTPANHEPLIRQVLACELMADANSRDIFDFPKGSTVWVTDDGSVLTKLVCKGFKSRGYEPVVVEPCGDLPDTRGDEPVGLLILAPVDTDQQFISDAFRLLKTAGDRLQKAGNDAMLVGAMRLDGKFGLSGNLVNPMTAGLAGLIKSASHEWELGNCKVLDLADDFENLIDLAAAIVDETLVCGPIEVGITSSGLTQLTLNDEAVVADNSKPIESGDVIVISGGARGVTAHVAIAMARAWQATLLLLGRSELPDEEPQWLAGLRSESQIREALIEQSKSNGQLTPKQINEQIRQIMARREIVENLAAIESAGGKAIYRSVDIRDAQAVAKVIDEVRESVGPIRGVVHGAGVLADRLIADKTAEQFDLVFSTKVNGLTSLLSATAEDDLRMMAMFSSSTGRFGRRGQADYAAANEILNKTAQLQAGSRPECRVVSINWGPWDGGMVNDALKKVFADEGIGVIPLGAGSQYLVEELTTTTDGPVEIVILGPGSKVESREDVVVKPSANLHLAFERAVSVEAMPVLGSHVINGRAVLPVALMVEWLAHGAMHDNPGMLFHGFDDLRVFKGVIIDANETVSLQVYSGRGSIHDGFDFVVTELRSGDVLHARATIVLAGDLPDAPQAAESIAGDSYSIGDVDLYSCGRLFHGDALQGIEAIEGCSAIGIAGRAIVAPSPAEWISQPLRSTWIADPLVVDSGFQLMILWSQEHHGVGSLPTYVKRYRQYQRSYGKDSVEVNVQVESDREHAAEASIDFVHGQGGLVARMEGYECVLDASLNDAFKQNQLPQAQQH